MKTAIEIPQHEHDVVRVFAVSRPIPDMARLLRRLPKEDVASELLNHDVTAQDIELFPLSDLTGVGLPQYLADGYDIAPNAIRSDHARLAALDGYVVFLLSRISNSGGITLHPTPDLTLIGTYAALHVSQPTIPIVSEAAKLYTGVTPPAQAVRRSRAGSAITAITTILTLILIWWIIR